jgi:hypothetical protein
MRGYAGCDPAVAAHGGESVLALIERAATLLDAQKAPPGKIVRHSSASHPRGHCLSDCGWGFYPFGATANFEVERKARSRLRTMVREWGRPERNPELSGVRGKLIGIIEVNLRTRLI